MAKTLSKRLLAYLPTLTTVGGDHDGQPFQVLDWERDFIDGAFAPGVGEAALSVARGNGKSAVVAGIASAVADPEGPLHGNRREVICVASSFTQGRVIFEDCLAMLREKTGLDAGDWRLQDSQNVATIEHRESRARIRCIGSDPRKAHGHRPALVVCDEPAQWDWAKADKMVAALRTGLGKVPGSRLIALGTRPVGVDHWFARALEQADYSQVHAAPDDCDPFDPEAIRAANPSYDHLPTLRERLATEARDAKRDPMALAAWRALRLNQGVGDTLESMLLDAATWRDAEGEADTDDFAVWGVDLGGSVAMSALASYWPDTGRLDGFAAFPEVPDLADRGMADGVGSLYADMAKRGELVIAGRRTTDLEAFLRIGLERYGAPVAVACDRYRVDELMDAMDAADFPECEIVERGQGYRDGAQDVRDFQRAVLDGRCVPVRSLLLRSAMAEARTVVDTAGNAKLAKKSEGGRRSRAKDDAVAAAILAVAVGSRMAVADPGPQWIDVRA
ncbi:MAG: hypothetical protein F4059_00080 [Gemmatimonadetes bacterium]|nr:hypothetical protein [Gemmatimonadota bacterium]